MALQCPILARNLGEKMKVNVLELKMMVMVRKLHGKLLPFYLFSSTVVHKICRLRLGAAQH